MKTPKIPNITIQNDFMFGTVMREENICKRFLEIILGIKIHHITYPENQKTIDLSQDAKSVRLDVYVEENSRNTVYDIEMQTTKNRNLPKRARYYQGMIDLNILTKGQDYEELKKSIVIFICPFDPFGQGEYKYHFTNVGRLSDGTLLELKDETEKIFINAMGTKGDVSEEFKELMDYIMKSSVNDDFTEMLNDQVLKVENNEKWRCEYMSLEIKLLDKLAEGKEIGEEIGKFESVATIMSTLGLSEEAAMEALNLNADQKVAYQEWKKEKEADK